MSVSAYLRRVARRWRLIGVVVALGLVAAVVLTLRADTTYVSTAQLYVASAGDDSDLEAVIADGVQVKGRALSYAAVASSEDMARVVSVDLDLSGPLTDTTERIHTEVPFATVVINLGAEGDTAQDARDLARSVVTNYNDVLAELETADVGGLAVEVAVLQEPTLPDGPTTPRPVLNLLVGLLAGLMVGVAAAVLRDLADDSVQGPDDLRALGLVPVAVLPAGADLTDPGFGRARVSLDAALSGLDGRTVVVAPCTARDEDPSVVAGLEAALADDGTTLVGCGPTRDLPDARSAARRGDGAVVVATAGRTSRDDLREAAVELREVGARVLGVILRDERRV